MAHVLVLVISVFVAPFAPRLTTYLILAYVLEAAIRRYRP